MTPCAARLGLGANLACFAPILLLQAALFHMLVPGSFLNWDVAWFVTVADGVLFEGRRLYVDFVEPNAPLASLTMAPAAAAHRWLGLPLAEAVRVWVLLVTGVSFTTSFLIARRFPLSATALLFFQAALLWVMLILPGWNFGQRESLFANLATPYVLAAALRETSFGLKGKASAWVGFAAFIGAAMKPPMAIALAAVEVLSIVRTRRLAHVESLVLTGGVLLYVLLTYGFAPEYFHIIGSWATGLYFAYSDMPGDTALAALAVCGGVAAVALAATQSAQGSSAIAIWPVNGAAILLLVLCSSLLISFAAALPMWMKLLLLAAMAAIALVTMPRAHGGSGDARLVENLCVASIGAFIAFVIQWKGWTYQWLPVHHFAVLTLAAALATNEKASLFRMRGFAMVAVPFLFFGIALTLARQPNGYRPRGEIHAAVSSDGGAFLVLSTDVVKAFPDAAEIPNVWASRYPCLILLPGLIKSEAAHGGVVEPRFMRVKDEFVANVVDDLRRHQPTTVMAPKGRDQAMPEGLTALDWLLRSPLFASEWSKYREVEPSRNYRIFRRITPADNPTVERPG